MEEKEYKQEPWGFTDNVSLWGALTGVLIVLLQVGILEFKIPTKREMFPNEFTASDSIHVDGMEIAIKDKVIK